MKTIFKIIIAVVIIAILYLAYKTFFGKKGKSLSASNKLDCNSRILFIGDSLTAFDQSYADQLLSVCPYITIKKVAKVGEKTDWMLGQLSSELASDKYDAVVIWGGVNDIYARKRIDSAESNLQAMYDMVKQNGARVIGITVIPTRTYNVSTDKDIQLTNSLNRWILSNGTLDAVVNANALLNDGNDGTKPEYLQGDTLHITAAGQYVIMQDFVKKVINA